VPKKRGPKTDVLEALLKRVDGLEKRLKTEDEGVPPPTSTREKSDQQNRSDSASSDDHQPKIDIPTNNELNNHSSAIISPTESFAQPTPTLYPEALLDIYFSRLHGKPLSILDEASTRQRLQNNQLPNFLAFAIYALSARYANQFGGYSNAVRVGHDYYRRARMELDVDEPSIESLQALLLLTQAAFQQGKGKKAYMHLSKFLLGCQSSLLLVMKRQSRECLLHLMAMDSKHINSIQEKISKLISPSYRYQYGIRFESAPRTAKHIESHISRKRSPEKAVLGMLHS